MKEEQETDYPASRPAVLELADGSEFHGYSFGADIPASGEVVFHTAMTGYPESLSDPSYKGQILVSTYPLIGNYGVPGPLLKDGLTGNFESDSVQVAGLVISDYSFRYNHWNASKSLARWLREENVPAIFGIDTREVTKRLRENGSVPGRIRVDERKVPFLDPNAENLVSLVSGKEIKTYGHGKHRILLVDCGTKNNIIRCLLARDATVTTIPWDMPFNPSDFDGILLSNGPGDPKTCIRTIDHMKIALQAETPVFGICLGSQIMALAAGADTFKLKYGHRSHNQPVRMEGTDRCFVTSQNHGYAVDTRTLPAGWLPWFTNLNDGTCEGIRHAERPFSAVQFHPEASAGPVDTEFLFDVFMSQVSERCR
jgi:carbamoyl-phosphate synthase small subunit